ncbi:hypothetical protein LINGRAHAP2_LOCUS6697 [Linum grandiflorum]
MNLLTSIQGRIQARFQGRQPLWIRLRYEDLPTVCFICGLLGHGHDHCPYSGILSWNHQERGPWMLAKPHGHKMELPDLSDASTSKQKAKYLKPVPCDFHTYVTVEDGMASSSGIQHPSTTSVEPGLNISIADIPICENMQVLNIDHKRPRDEASASGDEFGCSSTPKKRRLLLPLTEEDFPAHAMDLELLPDDTFDSDPDMIAVSAALSTSQVVAANLDAPPHQNDVHCMELPWDWLLPGQ